MRVVTETQRAAILEEAAAIGAIGNGIETCLVCGAPISDDGKTCTAVNAPFHISKDEKYGWVDQLWYQSGMFHTSAEAHNAPPVTFLIKDFLQREGVTALAAPVRERKSLIALNIAHALCTGEKLFGHFEVVRKILSGCSTFALKSALDPSQTGLRKSACSTTLDGIFSTAQ